MFFGSWFEIGRILLVGTLTYILLIVALRLGGKRSLSKMNIFDFVVTIGLGSVFASTLLNKSFSLATGMTAIGLMVFLQYSVSWLTVHFNKFRKLVKASPEAIFYNGNYLHEAMRRTRIDQTEILQNARKEGIASMDEVEAVVLETNGDLSIIRKTDGKQLDALQNVKGIPVNHSKTDS
ncbi:DUF421 domain-containing protein [Bhargavaea cecembensis]|uniref:DUF421 domain-containing protein n=1 Tax=Bhargavaea cecembensis TaxID=394098 RepID=UPI00058E97EC|nr:YetF domain-containing protein [Bhargavaea cecembensis]